MILLSAFFGLVKEHLHLSVNAQGLAEYRVAVRNSNIFAAGFTSIEMRDSGNFHKFTT